MIIVFGTRGITTTKERGDFHCPGCRDQQPYRFRRVRRWFTLYWIPVIPLDRVGEYVECEYCKATWQPGVLHHDGAAEDAEFEAEFQRAIRRVMVMMMMADGKIEAGEMETIQTVYEKIGGKPLSEQTILDEAEQVRTAGKTVTDYVKNLVGSLNPEGRELVLKSAFFVAAADGVFQDEEKEMLSELAHALQIQPGRFQEIIDNLLADDQPAQKGNAGVYG